MNVYLFWLTLSTIYVDLLVIFKLTLSANNCLIKIDLLLKYHPLLWIKLQCNVQHYTKIWSNVGNVSTEFFICFHSLMKFLFSIFKIVLNFCFYQQNNSSWAVNIWEAMLTDKLMDHLVKHNKPLGLWFQLT